MAAEGRGRLSRFPPERERSKLGRSACLRSESEGCDSQTRGRGLAMNDLYERDILLWSEQQGELLRRRRGSLILSRFP
jgi:hypothetical protein